MTWRLCLHCRNAANNVRAVFSASLVYRRVSLARQWRYNLHFIASHESRLRLNSRQFGEVNHTSSAAAGFRAGIN
jgi:hypothetical protein